MCLAGNAFLRAVHGNSPGILPAFTRLALFIGKTRGICGSLSLIKGIVKRDLVKGTHGEVLGRRLPYSSKER